MVPSGICVGAPVPPLFGVRSLALFSFGGTGDVLSGRRACDAALVRTEAPAAQGGTERRGGRARCALGGWPAAAAGGPSRGFAATPRPSDGSAEDEDKAEAKVDAPTPWREYAIVTASTGVLALGIGAVVPVLPLFVRDAAAASVQGTDQGVNTAVGLAMAAPSLTRALFNAPTASIADRYGRVPPMVLGPLAVSLSQLGTACATTVTEVVPWRLLLGAGQAMQGTSGQLLLADLTARAPETRARVMGATQVAFLAGFSMGPGLGGYLAEKHGPASAFYAVATGCAVCAGLNALLKETKPPFADETVRKVTPNGGDSEGGASATAQQAAPATGLAAYREQLQRSDVQAAAIVQLASSWTMGGGFVLTPHLLADVYGFTPASIGAQFTLQAIASLLGSMAGSYVADKYGRKVVIVPTMLAQGICTLAMACAGSDPTFFVGSMLIRSLALGAFLPGNSAYAADIARTPEERGKVLAVTRTTGDVGQLLGPVVAGVVADHSGPVASLAMLGGVNVAAAVAFFARARESLRAPGGPSAKLR